MCVCVRACVRACVCDNEGMLDKIVSVSLSPQDVVRKFGADTVRVFILFKAPPEADMQWDSAGW